VGPRRPASASPAALRRAAPHNRWGARATRDAAGCAVARRHPETGVPNWFCNIHSHSAKLRDDRDGVLPETTGASKLNKSDTFYGDGSVISDEDLKHVDEVTRKNMVFVKMQEGDVVLVDNYRTMHGRDVFEGTRKHGVTWLK